MTEGGTRHLALQESVPAPAVRKLAEFVESRVLTPNLGSFVGSSYKAPESGEAGRFVFSWQMPLREREGVQRALSVLLSIAADGVTLDLSGFDPASPGDEATCGRVADQVEAAVSSFLTYAKRTSLYFVFSGGGGEAMEAPAQDGSLRREVIRRILAGNSVNLYLLLIVISFFLFAFVGNFAIVVMVAIQGIALYYSDALVQGMGAVRPTEARPDVTVVSVLSTPETIKSLSGKGKSLLPQIRERLAKELSTGTMGADETKAEVQKVLAGAGVQCSVDDIEVKTRNPYAVVKEVSDKFHLPAPKIAIVNSPAANAAATGASSRRSSITITAGSLEDLSDDELESVVGHELGHVKGHDPLILFFLTAIIYIGGYYLWLPVVLDLGLFYFIFAFGFIYTIGKFLETRADTESAMVIGKPQVLASALTAIGFRELYLEKYTRQLRFLDWLKFDPHPPIYFRVERLEEIASSGEKIKHTLLVSVRDVVSGFFRALLGIG